MRAVVSQPCCCSAHWTKRLAQSASLREKGVCISKPQPGIPGGAVQGDRWRGTSPSTCSLVSVLTEAVRGNGD